MDLMRSWVDIEEGRGERSNLELHIIKYISGMYTFNFKSITLFLFRMLNFTDYICAVSYDTAVFGQGSGNVWLTNLRCYSYHQTLDQCGNSYPQQSSPCSHTDDAAVICQGM